ncbi:DUF2690 domain-containing protein [Streptomyces sp. 7N604]|uniref:DUF2690 domain-containing protein n=1 Tax=Streptomyces sp. 7N604 TaxID=3457415 RepID=UPI003FD05918
MAVGNGGTPNPPDPPAPAPSPGPSSPGRGQRLRAWVRGHGPQTLAGGLIVAVAAAAAGAFVTGLFDSGGDEPAGKPPVNAGPSRPGADGPLRDCIGGACQGQDPSEFGCNADAQVLAERTEPVRLQLKYSPTCRAAWGRILEAGIGDQVVISPAVGKAAKAVISSGHDNYTKMVAAEGQFRLTACAEADESSGSPAWTRFCVDAGPEKVSQAPVSGAAEAAHR